MHFISGFRSTTVSQAAAAYTRPQGVPGTPGQITIS
jgi:hypothetical protein